MEAGTNPRPLSHPQQAADPFSRQERRLHERRKPTRTGKRGFHTAFTPGRSPPSHAWNLGATDWACPCLPEAVLSPTPPPSTGGPRLSSVAAHLSSGETSKWFCPAIKRMRPPQWLSGKEYGCTAGATGDMGSILGSGRSLGRGSWRRDMATHFSIPSWRTPWTEEL